MSTRKFTLLSLPKLTLFYLPLIVIASVAVGMVIASRLDLSPAGGQVAELRVVHKVHMPGSYCSGMAASFVTNSARFRFDKIPALRYS